MGRLAVLLCLIGFGCVESNSVRCDFGLCPIGTACDDVNDKCVLPDQLKVCKGHADGEPCTIVTANDGVCKDEICVAPTCGDELVTTGEQCDASTPAEGTCVDAAYDYGVLGCDATCSPSTDSCHRLGWHYTNVPGGGGIGAIWEDGADVWVANQNGVLHYDGTTWTGPTVVTGSKWWVRGIWAGGGHVFAVGSRATSTTTTDGVLAHYNGSAWSEMSVPGGLFYAVWARSANEAYAVGKGGAVYRYNNGTWTSITPSVSADLHAVWGNAQVVVTVGDNGTVLASMNGNTFPALRSNVADEYLRGVWGPSSTNIYVVGYSQPTAAKDPLVLHYDGSLPLAQVTLPIEVTGAFNAITGRGDREIYVAGEGTVLASDSVTWRAMEVPTAYPLNAIHAGASSVYAAYQSPYFIQFDGAAWVKPNSDDPRSTIYDVWANDTELVAVGACSFLQYANANDGLNSVWKTIPAPTGGNCQTSCPFLLSVWGSSTSDVYAGGPYGNLFHRANDIWSCVYPRPLGDEKWIWTIWGTGPNDVWLGGGKGDDTEVGLAHFNGTSWTDRSSEVLADMTFIHDIWGTGPNDVYFVGKPGAIVHYNGSSFTKMQTPTTNSFNAIHGLGPNDVFAAGDQGTIVHYNGTAWSLMTVPTSMTVSTTSDIRDLCGRNNDLYAIGGRMLLHYNGTGWAPMIRPDGDDGTVCRASGIQLLTAGELGAGSRLVGRLSP